MEEIKNVDLLGIRDFRYSASEKLSFPIFLSQSKMLFISKTIRDTAILADF